ncbi:MAG TPA: hypothetical protein VFT74_18895 [Isosphaeraceae bacterium]|nr:hypothetical protein [Isosphaeraceae bacterium]
MARRLSKYLLLREDKVATRALTDILGKAVESGQLSDVEKRWATKLIKAVEKSGPDQLVYPKLSFDDEAPEAKAKGKEKPTASAKGKAKAEPKRGIDVDPTAPDRAPDPHLDQTQSVWDTFANYPMKSDTDGMELGAAGAPPRAEPAPGEPKKPGMLSRIFSKRPKAQAEPKYKPTAGLAQSTWDDLSHSGPKAPEPRNKKRRGADDTWSRFSNSGEKGERK